MAEISASQVKELRDITGLGMMECKKALVEVSGDISKAEKLLRVKSGTKANKVSGRIAAEGKICVYIDETKKTGAMIEVNCETDFVAKDPNFTNFVTNLCQLITNQKVDKLDDLKSKLINNEAVESVRQNLIMKLGENITIRRICLIQSDGFLYEYTHGNKIGVLIDLSKENMELGKDIAMHIAAMKPIALDENDVDIDIINKEQEIAKKRAMDSGKPPEIAEKIVKGSVRKFLSEVTLLGQKFVKNDKLSIDALLKEKNNSINLFRLFVVGEGIEKKSVDFAQEVQDQISK